MTDATLRFSIFLGVFAGFALLELMAPRRRSNLSRRSRWPGAWVLLFAGGVLSRLIMPLGLAGLALWTHQQGFGLLNQISLPAPLAFLLSLVVLDLAVWAQHIAMHRFGFLWRLHRVHHTDPHIDVTTALRFHPVEILVSLGWKGLVVLALGPSAAAAFWFEVALNAFAQFNHANVNLPLWADRIIRMLIVTPDMHRVHHSVKTAEHNRNFGFCFSLWDRLFRLYKDQPDAGHDQMQIGQEGARQPMDQRPDRLLWQPRKGRLD